MQPKEEIKEFIVENFLYGQDDTTMTDDASFLENGIIDSTGVLELVSFVQETFGFRVEDEEINPENFDSISKISGYITTKQKNAVPMNAGASQESIVR